MCDLGNIIVDYTSGETLPETEAGTNGLISIDNRTTTTRTIIDPSSSSINSTINVYYDDKNLTNLDASACSSNICEFFWKKTTQNTTQPEEHLVTNNGAVLNLYTDKLVDASYNTTDFDLSFNSTLDASLNDINIWKINLVNNLVSTPD